MAATVRQVIADQPEAAFTACTVPLRGRRWKGRSPVAGDLVIVNFISPQSGVIAAAGWAEFLYPGEDGTDRQAFWRIIDSRDPDPVFYCGQPADWEWTAAAVYGCQVPDGTDGSATPATVG